MRHDWHVRVAAGLEESYSCTQNASETLSQTAGDYYVWDQA